MGGGVWALWGRVWLCGADLCPVVHGRDQHLVQQHLCRAWTGQVPCGAGPLRGGGCPRAHLSPHRSHRRLERLQRVVTKLQMESGLCEEQLNQADALLQAVSGQGGRSGGGGR